MQPILEENSSVDKLIIVCGVNGGRRKEDCPAVPYTPSEIAAEASRAEAEGAAVVHVHGREPDGTASYDPHVFDSVDKLIRQKTNMIINHSLARPTNIPYSSIKQYLTGTSDPVDMVAVNLGNLSHARPEHDGWKDGISPSGINDIIQTLDICYDFGIVPEPAILDYGMVNTALWLSKNGKLRSTHYFMIEFAEFAGIRPVQHMPASTKGYHFMMDLMEEYFPGSIRLAHGYQSSTYTIAMQAIASGHGLRIGLEDSLTLPNGALAQSNADLIKWVVDIARSYGREPATPSEARKLLMDRSRVRQ